MEPIDSDTLKRNCENYFNSGHKALDVLRNANGKRDYKEIAKLVGLHPTKVSSFLKKSLSYGLSNKDRNGFYHKKSGILGHMPKRKHAASNNTENSGIDMDKISRKGLRASKISNTSLSKHSAQNTDKMAEAYVWLYTTENVLRGLIRKVLGTTATWWKSRVNKSIQDAVTGEMKKAPYDGANRKDELEYTHLGQLCEIIISSQNWPQFGKYIHEKNKTNFQLKVTNAIPSRNSIGHCIPLDANDRAEVVVRFRDILKMIK